MKIKLSFHLFSSSLCAVGLVYGASRNDGPRNLQLLSSIGTYYTPQTIVTDYAALDLDLRLMRHFLDDERLTTFMTARRIYQEGAYSRPVAELILDAPLPRDVPYGAEVIGTAYVKGVGRFAKGTLHNRAFEGDDVVQVIYNVRDGTETADCLVRASPEAILDGCFAQKGDIELPDFDISTSYHYRLMESNWNARSFQRESLYSRERLYECDNCPKSVFAKFVAFYGMFDYADHFIMRAFEGSRTDVVRGNNDFRRFSWIGLGDVIESTIVWMTMWMEVISRMERSIDACFDNGVADRAPLEFWDSAVAFYTGSQVSDDGGMFLFGLAEYRCLSASTCGAEGNGEDGTAWVNLRVLDQFNAGQNQIMMRGCQAASRSKDEIVRLMTIPLIQGTLRRARTKESNDDELLEETNAAEGAIFAASILPLVFDCNSKDAEIIHRYMHATSPEADFEAVRDAFGRNLKCLDIGCDEIGDVLELSPNHKFCRQVSSHMGQVNEVGSQSNGLNEADSGSKPGSAALYVFIGIAFLVICYLSYKKITGKSEIEKASHHAGSSYRDNAEASETITGSEHTPQYWEDCDVDDKPRVAGEML